MPDLDEQIEVRQLRNQNALEVAKLYSEELNHYRARLSHAVTSFSALCLLIAGAVQTYSGTLSRSLAVLMILVLVALALWVSDLLLITRRRAGHARLLRQRLLESIDLPKVSLDGQVLDLNFGLPRFSGASPDTMFGVTALSWLIVAFVALVPIFAIVNRIE